MVFRIVQSGGSLPISWPVDPTSEFQPGMVAQLGSIGNNIVCGVSDGTAPIGIIDEIKTNAFTSPSIDEPVIAHVPAIARQSIGGGRYITTIDIQYGLDNSNIIRSSFTISPIDAELVAKNGNLIFPAGTELNFDNDGDGNPDSIRVIVSYTYQVPNVPGDDSTAGSGKMTVWFGRMIAQTDMFETNQRYPLNANLFVSECGQITTRQPSPKHPGIAVVTGTPTAIHGSLEFMWI